MITYEQAEIIGVMCLGLLVVVGTGLFYFIIKSKSPEDIEIEDKLKEIHW